MFGIWVDCSASVEFAPSHQLFGLIEIVHDVSASSGSLTLVLLLDTKLSPSLKGYSKSDEISEFKKQIERQLSRITETILGVLSSSGPYCSREQLSKAIRKLHSCEGQEKTLLVLLVSSGCNNQPRVCETAEETNLDVPQEARGTRFMLKEHVSNLVTQNSRIVFLWRKALVDVLKVLSDTNPDFFQQYLRKIQDQKKQRIQRETWRQLEEIVGLKGHTSASK
ncbi:hypothetical protein F2Q69_00025076 [Brassica cretica]|uniref:Uncharacterized protein n=1 Tax=Brassica cretica TaxID=69181 RepID=A0A8S9QJM5_BRACR|nr:hypothetical protein F2Q69_00025076 [Brassica cretica]